MKITYLKGDMFTNLKPGDLPTHACNCQGVWGAGVAKRFKEIAVAQFDEYRRKCLSGSGRNPGDYDVLLDVVTKTPVVGCLYTSKGYGDFKDSVEDILKATEIALPFFLQEAQELGVKRIVSPKINSGLFGVPWEKTAEIIDYQMSDLEWVVYEL